jgi:hypothetical protein
VSSSSSIHTIHPATRLEKGGEGFVLGNVSAKDTNSSIAIYAGVSLESINI